MEYRMEYKMRKRYKHNLSHTRKTTFMPGVLHPFSCVEVIPGDTFDLTSAVLLRCSPLLAPVMAKARVRMHWFFQPHRVSWPKSEDGGWEGFITQQPLADAIEVPSFSLDSGDVGSELQKLYEHLGCPLDSLTGSINLSQLPGRAYWDIWNNYFRDKDLQSAIDITDFSDTSVGIQSVCWPKDDYTSARPAPGAGGDITLPVGVDAPVVVNRVHQTSNGADLGEFSQRGTGAGDPDLFASNAGLRSAVTVAAELRGTADLTLATGVSVDALREAVGLQRYAERINIYGGNKDYNEWLLGIGIKSSDSRLQRPEYLGGGYVNISFSEVLSTDGDNTGNMFGHGIAPGRTAKIRRFFEEHGYLIGVISVVPEAVYTQSVPRHFFKGHNGGVHIDSKLLDDFYQPELEHIGQSAILKRELYPTGGASDDDVFAYQRQYFEYCHQPHQVTGEFKPGEALQHWTWSRSFVAPPTLNGSFVACDPSNRIFVDQTGTDLMWAFVNTRLIARRMVGKRQIGRIF